MTISRAVFTVLAALACSPSARADALSDNFKGFRQVCLNVNVNVGVKTAANQQLTGDAQYQLAEAMKTAGIPVITSNCQSGSTATKQQINVSYTFRTTKDGAAYYALMTAWLFKDGRFYQPTLWTEEDFASVNRQAFDDLVLDDAQLFLRTFVKAWKSAH